MNRVRSYNHVKFKKRRSRRARKKDPLKDPVTQTYWAAEQDEVETAINLKQRLALLRQFGDSTMAYSTAVQPLLRYFVDNESQQSEPTGFIAYRSRWGLTFALGDPVVADENLPGILEKFISNSKPSFCGISQATAQMLDSKGYFVNEMGVDSILDLQTYDFAGKEKEWLRYASNWIAKRGYKVQEASFDHIDVDGIEAISEAWRKTRTIKRKEVRFLNRPIVLEDEPDVRKFYLLSPEKKPLAFVFFDPLYRDGNIVGYVTAIKRRCPDAPLYAEHAIMKHAIEKLKYEGVEQIRLGLSPGAFIEDDYFRSNRLTSTLIRRCFESKKFNRFFYSLQGHANYKRRFRGREVKTYYASPARIDIPRQMALIGLCGLA